MVCKVHGYGSFPESFSIFHFSFYIQTGDEIISLDEKKVTHQNWRSTLNRYREGDRVSVSFKRDRQTLHTTIVLGPPDRFEYRIEEKTDATSAPKALRAAWLRG